MIFLKKSLKRHVESHFSLNITSHIANLTNNVGKVSRFFVSMTGNADKISGVFVK
jgi:hypothetical protein